MNTQSIIRMFPVLQLAGCAGVAARLFTGLLLLVLAVHNAQADYRVTRSIYLSGMTGPYTECGSNNTADQCAPGDVQSGATSVSGSAGSGLYSGYSSADLATGDLRISAAGPTYQSSATAEFMDMLNFGGIASGTFQTVIVDIILDGTYRDGSYVSFDAGFLSGTYGGTGDYLSVDAWYGGSGSSSSPGDPVSGTSFNLADACADCDIVSSGIWNTLNPTHFLGQFRVYGDDPRVTVTMGISGSGYFDLSNTASLSFILPEGVGFVSDSGVFLSAVPLPEGVWLFMSGLVGILGSSIRSRIRRKDSSRVPAVA